VRHAVGRGAAEQDGFAVRELHFVGGQVQVQGARLAAEAGGNPSSQQVDGRDDAIAAVAVEDHGAGCERFHGVAGQRSQCSQRYSGLPADFGYHSRHSMFQF